MLKQRIIIPIIVLMLLLCSCSNSSETAVAKTTVPVETVILATEATITETIEEPFDSKDIDDILQGTWSYVDTNIGSTEVLQFDNGAFSLTYTLDVVPDKATHSIGEYKVYDGYVSIYFPKTDYTNIIDYSWIGKELILHKYIDTGADKGNTRVYVKQDTVTPSISLPAETEPNNYIPGYTNVTAGMRNALQAAENYLAIMPFSHAGLIEQLEFEGYSTKDATYAADNCGADWFEQAAWSAKNYLEIMPFSRSGLIEQLEFEGYSYEQAVYGVDKAY